MAEVRDQQATLTPEEKRLDRWKERLRKSKDDAHNCTADESKDVSKKPPPGYAILFDQIEARSAEDLEAHIDAIARDLKSDEKLMKDQEKINRSYQEKKQSMDTLTEEIAQLREDREAALKETTISNQTLYFLLCNTIQFKEMLTVVGNLILMFPVTVIFLLLMACIVIYVRLMLDFYI